MVQLAALLSEFVEAKSVLLAIGDASDARIEYIFEDGVGLRPEDAKMAEDSRMRQVLSGGESILYEGPPSAVLVPVAFGGNIVGALSVRSHQSSAYDIEDVAMLESCAIYLGARIHDEHERLEMANLKHQATTDPLTGVGNRRGFDEALAREWQRCARSKSPLSVLLFDVDLFKLFNDTYGHIAGDGCLRQIAEAIGRCASRPGDVVARYGGEEFSIVLPETTLANARQVAETACVAVRELQIPHQGSSLGHVTVSVGCASVIPDTETEPQSLTASADLHLYGAKAAGRNRVTSDGYSSEAPPAVRQATLRHNLPSMRTSFLGREDEIAEIGALLTGARLVTIVGPGGVGKTRLAIEYGQRNLEQFPDGVWFIDLAPIAEGVFLSATALATMGVREAAGRDTDDTLAAHLSERKALIVLDNCEHLIGEAAVLVDRLLEQCPWLQVIATSREMLDIPGESLFRVSTFREEESVALFVSRARAVVRTFDPTPETMSAIKEICRRLDGIPLAIELAAARVKTMTVTELRGRLDDRFRVLTGGRTSLPRQQTLRGLIGWSYNLLDENEKALLRRLAVFAGDFSMDAACAVCAGEPLDERDIVTLLGHLVDKSLVQFEPGGDVARYWLLDSTKEFALERLADAAEWDAMQQRRADHFCRAADAAYAAAASESKAMFAAVERDYAEFRAVFQWALSREDDAPAALSLAGVLHRYWYERGQWREGRYWLERVTRNLRDDSMDPQRWLLLFGLVRFYLAHASIDEAQEISARLVEIADRLDNRVLVLAAHLARGLTLFHASRLTDALPAFERGIEIYEMLEAGERESAMALAGQNPGMTCELGIAITLWLAKRSDTAQDHIDSAARIAKSLNSPFQMAAMLSWSALFHYLRGDMKRALAEVQQAHDLAKEHGFALWLATCKAQLGVLLSADGHESTGEDMLVSALAMVEEHSALMVKSRVLTMLAQARLNEGRVDEGLDSARQGLAGVTHWGERWWESELHRLEGELLSRKDPPDTAGALESFRRALETARRDNLDEFTERAQRAIAESESSWDTAKAADASKKNAKSPGGAIKP
jgi:diguanylate cyclase (GGDEF)-like protein